MEARRWEIQQGAYAVINDIEVCFIICMQTPGKVSTYPIDGYLGGLCQCGVDSIKAIKDFQEKGKLYHFQIYFAKVKINFALMKINFALMKINFALMKINFALMKINFALMKINFALMKINFALMEFNFALMKINFALTKINFAKMKTNFALIEICQLYTNENLLTIQKRARQ